MSKKTKQQRLVKSIGSNLDLTCPCESGKKFSDCHGKNAGTQIESAPTGIVVGGQVISRKLDLACGQNKREGFEGVDYVAAPGVDIVHDLNVYPWPFADNSIAELHCSHYIEHIPAIFVDTPQGKKDALLAFFDECYRILVPDGFIRVQWPHCHSDRAFQDPTHRRYIPPQMTFYISSEWRRLNKLDHYNVSCDFIASVEWVLDQVIGTLAPEVQQRKIMNEWNGAIDSVASCKAVKPAR